MVLKPDYFDEIRQQALDKWKRREEGDAEAQLAIQTLFEQVKNPNHVISELIQNADDAGATTISAKLEGHSLIFEHNGKDFTRKDFEAISRFAFSNKRQALTIGFRGIGFRSVFSLGDRVEIYTPTLSVYFAEEQFTVPYWISGEVEQYQNGNTIFRIPLCDTRKESFLKQELEKWQQNPYPLLFLNNIREACFGDKELSIESKGTGPVRNSDIKYIHGLNDEVVMFKSDLLNFPEVCKSEIRQVRRMSEGEDIPPAELIFFLSKNSSGTLFVFLPALSGLEVSVSFHAPFIQDPARNSIASPITSVANEWLLDQMGQFIGETFLSWLRNSSLSLSRRCDAYDCMVPPEGNFFHNKEILNPLVRGFYNLLANQKFIISTSGKLCDREEIVSLPKPIDSIWDEEGLLRLFASEKLNSILAPDISEENYDKLAGWKFISKKPKADVLDALTNLENRPLKPDSWEKLFTLWKYVSTRGYYYSYQSYLNDWGSYCLIPIANNKFLYRRDEIILPPMQPDAITDEEWAFLLSTVYPVDHDLILKVNTIKEQDSKEEVENGFRWNDLKEHLSNLELFRPSSFQKIINISSSTIFDVAEPQKKVAIKIIQLAFKLGATLTDLQPTRKKTGLVYRFLCEYGEWKDRSHLLLSSILFDAQELIPLSWYKNHALCKEYFDDIEPPRLPGFIEWLNSKKGACLNAIPLPQKYSHHIRSKAGLERFCAKRLAGSFELSIQRENFEIIDFKFNDELYQYWESQSEKNPDIWFNLLKVILLHHRNEAEGSSTCNIVQYGNTNSHHVRTEQHPISTWIEAMRSKRCTKDQNGNLCYPYELMLSNRDTKPYYDYEAFILPTLDEPLFHPILTRLGVRDKPESADSLIDQLRAFSDKEVVDDGDLPVVRNIYRVLQKLLAEFTSEQKQNLINTFQGDRLVPCQDGWRKPSQALIRNEMLVPGFSNIHSDLAEFENLLVVVGVKRRPDESEIFAAIKGLENKKLSSAEMSNLKQFISENSEGFVAATNLWLSCEGTLRRSDEFEHKTRRPGLISDAFLRYKRHTCDLSFLNDGILFSDLEWIEEKVHFRVTNFADSNLPVEYPEWYRTFAEHMLSIGDTEGGEEDLVSDRNTAQQLLHTRIHYCSSISGHLTIAGVAASDTKEVIAKWVKSDFWLNRSNMKYISTSINELKTAFIIQKIKDAISYCAFRSEQAIKDYCHANFDLSFVRSPDLPAENSEFKKHKTTNLMSVGILTPDDESIADNINYDADVIDTEPEQFTKSHKIEKPSNHNETGHERHDLKTSFLDCYGFSEIAKDHYKNSAGRKLKSADPPFHFIEFIEGEANYYWLSKDDYQLDKGVRIPAIVWEYCREFNVVFAFIGEGHFIEKRSCDIKDLIAAEKAELVPTEYRFRST